MNRLLAGKYGIINIMIAMNNVLPSSLFAEIFPFPANWIVVSIGWCEWWLDHNLVIEQYNNNIDMINIVNVHKLRWSFNELIKRIVLVCQSYDWLVGFNNNRIL